MEYYGKFGQTFRRIQHIDNMIITEICSTACRLGGRNVAYNIPGFKYHKCCIQYMASHPHKPIFIIMIIVMDQISSYLHVVWVNLKASKPRTI